MFSRSVKSFASAAVAAARPQASRAAIRLAPAATRSAVLSRPVVEARSLAHLATATATSAAPAPEPSFTQPANPCELDEAQHEQLLLDVIAQHDLSASFKARDAVRVIRAPLMLDEEHLDTSLTYTTLCGAGKMSCRPIIFLDESAGALLGYYHLGRRLAGHQGIIHGGLQAVLLDECMARASFGRLPAKISVTANLQVNYKAPVPVNRYVVLKADTVKVEGRKAWVEGSVTDALTGDVYAQASGLFVQPKWADKMAPIR